MVQVVEAVLARASAHGCSDPDFVANVHKLCCKHHCILLAIFPDSGLVQEADVSSQLQQEELIRISACATAAAC